MKHPAVFLDRDGTIIENAEYIGDPDAVRLFPEAAEAIQSFRRSGYRVVLVSNQSGVARGKFTMADLDAVHARLASLLEAKGARLDARYYCPFLAGAEAVVDRYRMDSDARKPKPGLLFEATKDLNLDLSRSWMIGDSAVDVQAGAAAGCRTILLQRNGAIADETAPATHRVTNLTEAARIVEQGLDPQAREPNPSADAVELNPPVLAALQRIEDQLERAHRRERQHDFSFLRLFSALLQMLAVVAALWGLGALLDDNAAPATARLLLACFFQLGSLTAFVIDRFR